MSTIKTVNVTTGKVLHYTIKKDGFKPVTGSKLITGNETININMVSSTSTDGAYVFGDRLGGVATFVGYFDSVDPNTQATQKYAYFVCDAQYRSDAKFYNNYNDHDGLPKYSSAGDAINAKESGTYNTTTLLDLYGTTSPAINNARNPNGQSLIVTVDGVPYSPQVPNAYEINQIWINRDGIDANDPTLADNPNKGITTYMTSRPGGTAQMWSSNMYNNSAFWCYAPTWSGSWDYQSQSGFNSYSPLVVIPVFEIPVN